MELEEGAALLEAWEDEDVPLVRGVSDELDADREVEEAVGCVIEVELILKDLEIVEVADADGEDKLADSVPLVEDVLLINGVSDGLDVDREVIAVEDPMFEVELLKEVEIAEVAVVDRKNGVGVGSAFVEELLLEDSDIEKL